MSSESCPKCSGPRDAKALYCPFCGVIFARFLAAAAPAAAPAQPAVFAPAQAFGMSPAAAGGVFDDTFPLPPAQTVYGGPAPAAPQSWNPYQGPNAMPAAAIKPVAAIEHLELATRGSRLAAQLLNGIGLMILVAIACFTGIMAGMPMPDDGTDTGLLACVVVACAIWGAINLRQLSLTSQSVGKKAMGIRILKASGEKPTLVNLVFARYLSMQVLGAVPVAGPFFGLIDLLMILGVEQRCLHDRIAGTVVVKA